MKFILIPLIWLMFPIAFVVVAFDIAKSNIEAKVIAKLEENT